MLKNEIAFTKQALTATRDWDTYQAILRRCLASPRKSHRKGRAEPLILPFH